MNNLKNKEFRLSVANLIAAEEHIIEMMCNAEREEDKKILFQELKNIKFQRNNLLVNTTSEKDRELSFNKWCLIKHLLLSQYHIMEWVNQNDREYEEVSIALDTIKNLDNALDIVSVKEIKTDCKVCPNDLVIGKIFNLFK
ncbi:MAG: hypothetical protein ACRC5S_03780 [Cetobacterium sp.]